MDVFQTIRWHRWGVLGRSCGLDLFVLLTNVSGCLTEVMFLLKTGIVLSSFGGSVLVLW